MKKIMAMIVLAVCLAVQADTLEQPNQAGGKIVLTGRLCPKPGITNLRETYTYESTGTMGTGFSGVACRQAVGNRVAKDLATGLKGPLGDIQRAPVGDFFCHGHQL